MTSQAEALREARRRELAIREALRRIGVLRARLRRRAHCVPRGLPEAIAAAERACDAMIDAAIDARPHLQRLLSELEPSQVAILEARYLRARSWQAIAQEQSYSLRWVHELHARGMKRIRGD